MVYKLEELKEKEANVLLVKRQVLEEKKEFISHISGPQKDFDLIDLLIRKELGFSNKDEILLVN